MKFSLNKLKGRHFSTRLGKANVPKVKFSAEFLILAVISGLLSLLLVQNIYTSLSDLSNYKILSEEKSELEILQVENERLNKEKDYYESPYYVRLYARESLGLVEEGQELFVVERKKQFDYEKNNDRMEKLDTLNYRKWWIKLVL